MEIVNKVRPRLYIMTFVKYVSKTYLIGFSMALMYLMLAYGASTIHSYKGKDIIMKAKTGGVSVI